MRKLQFVILLIALSGAAGCATRGDLQSLERDVDESRRRLVKLEKDMDLLRKTANEEIQNTLRGFRRDMEAMRKNAAELQAAQDTIRLDLQELSGKTDDLKLLLQQRADEKSFLKEENDRRVAALEERLAKLEKKVDELKGPEARSGTEATPESIYQSGLDAYRSGDLRKALDQFTRFVERNPKHELTANARYWIGEVYYSEKNYEQAILAFQDVIKNYPKKDKAPAALLKQGLSFKALGDLRSARHVLNKVLSDYPRSEEAKKARDLLREIQ